MTASDLEAIGLARLYVSRAISHLAFVSTEETERLADELDFICTDLDDVLSAYEDEQQEED